jgi:L-lactate dehydrogenase complex protein LldG
MSSKDIILSRVRAALRDQPAVPDIPRDYRREFDPADLDLFVERLVDYKATVHRGADVPSTIKTILGTGTLIVPPGLDRSWLPAEVSALVDDGLPAGRIAAADGVVTAAAVGIAETGTIVLDASPDQGRRIISLLPDLHICVIRPDQVVAAVPEAVARLDPTRPLTWISGPSATSDIELNRVEGVHGPRNLHVILTP